MELAGRARVYAADAGGAKVEAAGRLEEGCGMRQRLGEGRSIKHKA